MATNQTTISDAEILDQVISSTKEAMSPEAARAFLEFRFDPKATRRIRQLLQKNNRGTISAPERITLEKFVRIGKLIDLLQARARLALKTAGVGE